MEINYLNLSGGINQSITKTELGADTKILYWTDAKNIEIFENRGLIKQKGNTQIIELPEQEAITGMYELESKGLYSLVITTASGKIYIYSDAHNEITLLNKTLTGHKVKFAAFLNGVVVATESDPMFYIKNNSEYEIEYCNLKDFQGNNIYPDYVTVYKGRVWCCSDSTIYYSALGTYDDFTTENDAGYISDFHTDTASITTMHPYKDYLAIYKRERVYLLTGSNPDDFAIVPFADKGAIAPKSVVNVDNKQYFLSNGIFALEQVGELNQIRLGSEISKNIKRSFEQDFDRQRIKETIALHYQNKNQMWFLFPYNNDEYFHTIWINDYVNHSWYKRVLPQNITCACTFNSYICTADSSGRIYREDYGSTFDGEPIEFMWKSPFLALDKIHHRKIIDEFYFILEDSYNNKFNFSVYKDYDSNYAEDKELIFASHYDHLVWADDNSPNTAVYCWNSGENNIPIWSVGTDVMEKAEIYGSSYSIQLCVDGNEANNNCAIIGLQFREIYNDD